MTQRTPAEMVLARNFSLYGVSIARICISLVGPIEGPTTATTSPGDPVIKTEI